MAQKPLHPLMIYLIEETSNISLYDSGHSSLLYRLPQRR